MTEIRRNDGRPTRYIVSMGDRFHSEGVERRLLVAIVCAASLIAGGAFAYVELLRDPATGRWVADGLDRALTVLSLCR